MTTKKRKKRNKQSLHLKNSRWAVLLLLVAVAFAVVTLTLFAKLIFQNHPYTVQTIPYDFKVRDDGIIGFNADTDALHLGGGLQGFQLQRELFVEVQQDSLVSILWNGPGNLKVDMNNFELLTNETQKVTFSLVIDSDLSPGNYSGELYLSFYELD